MTPHFMRVMHEPEKGTWGDCYRTAIACLLDLTPEEVPHCNGPEYDAPGSQDAAMREWLEARGLALITVGYPTELSPDEFLPQMVHVFGPRLRFIFSGKSHRRSCHAVVASASEGIVHDVMPNGGGLVGPWEGVYFATCIGKLV